jgi:predicted DNA-binding transcriptional regulator AlpA
MQRHFTTDQTGNAPVKPHYTAVQRLAINEHELSQRWGLSVKTLRRWRQEKLGPAHLKLGSRVSYLIEQIEAYERRVSRHSTSCAVYQ